MHSFGLKLIVALLIACGLLFGFRPDLDLMASRMFFDATHGFVAISPLGDMFRTAGYIVPFGLFAGTFLLWLARCVGARAAWLPKWRAVLFLTLTLAVGPGLLVNTVLKDNSHRPRPVQTLEFGGQHNFRPWYRFDGGCVRNCSFVSGEASTGFWTLAPALLTPPAIRAPAIVASLVFGGAVASLRMAYGGHYLSDSLFSALLTLLVVLLGHRLIYSRLRSPKAQSPKQPNRQDRPSGLNAPT